MKKIVLIALTFVTSFSFCQSKKQHPKNISKETQTNKVDENTPLVWFTDLMKADSISKKTNKPIFGFFTGSDWCGWCHKLQNDVFAKTAFIKWAKEKVVLLELDFPRKKQLPTELQQQNSALAQAFQVQGYPTIWMFTVIKDSSSTKNIQLNSLGSLGYPSNAEPGKEEVAFLETATKILSKTK